MKINNGVITAAWQWHVSNIKIMKTNERESIQRNDNDNEA